MEFHANGSAALGNPAGEVTILQTAPVQVKVPGHKCKLFIRGSVEFLFRTKKTLKTNSKRLNKMMVAKQEEQGTYCSPKPQNPNQKI